MLDMSDYKPYLGYLSQKENKDTLMSESLDVSEIIYFYCIIKEYWCVINLTVQGGKSVTSKRGMNKPWGS